MEAYVDILLQHGHGRTDAQRALELLEPAVERFPYHLGCVFQSRTRFESWGRFPERKTF